MNYWSRAKTWVFRGKQSWVLWSCFVSHNDFTVMCNKGLFDPVNQSRKSQLERAYKEEWKTNVLWEHLVPPFQQHFKTAAPNPTRVLVTQSPAELYCYINPDLTWVLEIVEYYLTVLYITSLCPHWPVPWSPSKSVGTTGIFNSITCCLGVWDTNSDARALKLGQLLLLPIKEKLNLKLGLPSRQNIP